MIPKRKLGRTGVEVSRIGLGGEGILRTFGYEKEARAVIERALDLGINYFDSARVYAGSEKYYGISLGSRRSEIFLTSKSPDRTAGGASEHLTATLQNMKTDYLDLWQVHDLRTEEDLNNLFAPQGAIEAFRKAKEEGKVRFLGLTGHQDPDILLRAMSMFDFDTVLMPVNPAEPAYKSFIGTVLPEALRREMGVIGMKVLCGSLSLRMPGYRSVEPWIRYALSHDVSTVVIGCETTGHVEENVTAAIAATRMTESERIEIEQATCRYATDLMYYK